MVLSGTTNTQDMGRKWLISQYCVSLTMKTNQETPIGMIWPPQKGMDFRITIDNQSYKA